MPNTPAPAREGDDGLVCDPGDDRGPASAGRSAAGCLGAQIEVDDEKFVAMATAVSGTGPTYVFLVMEALIEAKAAKPGKAAPAEKPTPRAGTKQALMIELLKRPEGATVEQIAAATGWQHHTIRGAISGALKKKLGLTVEATRTREVGPNKTGAKGSATTYRIVG